MNRVKWLMPVCIWVVISGCDRTPEGIIPLNEMKVIFLHHIMAEEMVNNYVARNASLNYDSARRVYFSGVMKLHKTDSATFAKSMNYYKADIGRFKELLDSVNALAVREKDFRVKFEEERSRKKEVADSIALADSLAKVNKASKAGKDSLGAAADSLKVSDKQRPGKRDSVVIPAQ